MPSETTQIVETTINEIIETTAIAESASGSGLSDLLSNSVIGFALVFAVLVLLMIFVKIINAIFKEKYEKSLKPVEEESAPAPERADVILEGISEPDAAMIMAIVADNSGIPIEKLRFISIREVE